MTIRWKWVAARCLEATAFLAVVISAVLLEDPWATVLAAMIFLYIVHEFKHV